jgi:glycosyltransferase involved in cell wall biosynthesis
MEGFGLAALEAAVMGKTVLVSDLEGMKDAIIDGKNGYRIETGNARVWADTICTHIEKNVASFKRCQRLHHTKLQLGKNVPWLCEGDD